jgi:hypothetical protein
MRSFILTDFEREVLERHVLTHPRRKAPQLRLLEIRIRESIYRLQEDYLRIRQVYRDYCSYEIGKYVKSGSESAKQVIITKILTNLKKTFRQRKEITSLLSEVEQECIPVPKDQSGTRKISKPQRRIRMERLREVRGYLLSQEVSHPSPDEERLLDVIYRRD